MPNEIRVDINGTDNLSGTAKRAQGSIEGLSATAVAKGTLIAHAIESIAVETSHLVKELVTGYAAAGEQIAILHQRTGLSSESLSETAYVAKILGTSIDALDVGIKQMNTTIGEAGRGGTAQIATLKALGLTYDDLKGKKPEEIFDLVTKRISGLTDETTQGFIANQLFGRGAAALLPIFRAGTDRINELKQAARDAGVTFSEEAAAKASRFSGELVHLEARITGLKYSIGEQLLPVLSDMTVRFDNWLKANGPALADGIARAVDNVAHKVTDVADGIDRLRSNSEVKVAIDVIANMKGDTLALAVLGAMFGLKVGGPIGALVGLGAVSSAAAQSKDPGVALAGRFGEALSGVAALKGLADLPKNLNGLLYEIGGARLAGTSYNPSTPLADQLRKAGINYPSPEDPNASALPAEFPAPGGGGGGSGLGNAPGSGAKSPLEIAWDNITAKLNKDLVEAFDTGGKLEAEKVRQHNAEIVDTVARTAQRVHDEFGVPLEQAVTDVFDKIIADTKAWASELDAIHKDQLDKSVDAFMKGKDSSLAAETKKNAAILDKATALANDIVLAMGVPVSDQTQRAQILAEVYKNLTEKQKTASASGGDLMKFLDAKARGEGLHPTGVQQQINAHITYVIGSVTEANQLDPERSARSLFRRAPVSTIGGHN